MAYMSLARLAPHLKKHRAKQKFSLREVADRAGLDYGFLSRVESGTYPNLGIETLSKIAKGYGLPLETLLIEAGFVDGEAPEIPELHTYLRTHVGLNDEGAKEVENFIQFAKSKYAKRPRS